jgi:arsenate reductase
VARSDTITIYHNPRCTKSRAALALLVERGIQPVIVEYLQTPPTAVELRAILHKLGLKPEQIVRKGEAIYKQNFAGVALDDDEWLEVLVKNPVLIERPIVVNGNRAAIGRPTEHIEALLKAPV